MHKTIGLMGLAALAGCSAVDLAQVGPQLGAQIDSLELSADTRRAIDVAYRDLPFDSGTVYAVAPEHGDLHTYSLTPCGGDHICGPDGRVGHVKRLDDFFMVTGAYHGRTFFLSPGGDGYVTWRGENLDLAWN